MAKRGSRRKRKLKGMGDERKLKKYRSEEWVYTERV